MWRAGTVPAKGQTRWWWCKKGDRRVCSSYLGYHTTQPSWEILLKGIGKEVSAICQNSDTETAVWFLYWPQAMDQLFTFSCLWGSTGSGGGLWSPQGFCGGQCGSWPVVTDHHCMTAMRVILIIKSSIGLVSRDYYANTEATRALAHLETPRWANNIACTVTGHGSRGSGGVSARQRANPCKPSVPSVLLINVRSLDDKMDHISLWRTLQRELRDCCVFVFMKTWLTGKIPDSGIGLAGLTLHRTDRVVSTSGKLHGGGLAIYINNSWCWDAKTIFNSIT